MNKDIYIVEINKIIELIKKSNLNSKIVLIAPWKALSGDLVSKVKGNEKNQLFNEYILALKEYSEKNNFLFINPNSYLEEFLNDDNRHDYMFDYIHPNNNKGIELYSEAVLKSSK